MSGNLPRGLMVSAFVPHSDGSHSIAEDLAVRLQQEGAAIIRVSSRRSSLMRALDMVATTLRRRHDYDVAIVGLYSGRAFMWGEAVAALLERFGRPFVLSLHGGALPVFAERHPERIVRTLRRAAVVTAPSRYLAEQMSRYCPGIVVVPNPIEVSRYRFRAREVVQPQLIWLRAFHDIYNPSLAVRVAARLREDFPGLHLTMVGPDKGDGSWKRTAETVVAILRPDVVEMPGGVGNADVPAWLDRGNIFLNTTNVDNTPVSVIEAMASGLPTVSTNVGGLPYLLDDGEDALLVPPDDPDAMAAAVRRLLTEPGLAGRLSSNARRKAETFDWSHVWPLWRDLLVRVG
jgi:glycosyltransferase involved in cell wall biosynthesis